MKKPKHIFIVFLFFAIIISSCTNNVLIHEHHELKNSMWNYNVKLPFNFEIKDTTKTYKLYFHLRINEDYPFSNIWIKSRETRPDQSFSENMIDIKLANKEGAWLGKGLGDIYDYKILIEDHKKFNQTGDYRYTFKHELRINELEGVMDVGFSAEEIEPEN
jgi:gliding motility-associated lipoprotein GldH